MLYKCTVKTILISIFDKNGGHLQIYQLLKVQPLRDLF